MPQSLQHITPRKAAELLKLDGIIMSEEEAGKLADFIYLIGDELINQYLVKCSEDKKK